ncbi:hypothetical protein [Salinirussus salinus]|uniref:hypothetical protein n=1 Tax=Salinirussus salinus TaxID=1198300 RepID=UPI0013574FC5|nr:hypothetical protein [Salinirussus salinus]
MDLVLNEVTNTVHRHETGRPGRQAVCGSMFHVSHDNLRVVRGAEPGGEAASATKCGRCFEDGGSY